MENEKYPAKEVIASCNVCSPSAQIHIITPTGPECKRCLAFKRNTALFQKIQFRTRFESGVAVIGNGLYARTR